jgi:hypothetical protein
MQKIISFLTVACICFIFSGCPYESAVPLDKPIVKINRLLLGNWKTDSSTAAFSITKADDFHYRIEEKEKDKITTYTGYLTNFDNKLFLNLLSESANKRSFSFAKVDIDPHATKITLSFMSDENKAIFSSSDALRIYIMKNISNRNFFEKDDLVFVKTSN